MQNHFLNFIKKHALIKKGDYVLLAVSGGIDSVVMAHLFKQSKIEFGIAHCNFGLRGQESDKDALFVEKLSKELGVAFHLKACDVKKITQEKGGSTQMAARALRYRWFDEVIKEFDYNKIATAHHKNDNVETLVHNLTRGTSISGLRGMLPINGILIRPFLDINRNELEEFASVNNIKWREDSSNNSNNYKRNFIRHEILPKFEQLNPNYLDVISTSMAKNEEVEGVFKNHLVQLREKLLVRQPDGSIKISIKELELEKIGPYILSELIKDYGFNFNQCRLIISKLEGNVGKKFDARDFVLSIDRTHLFIYANDQGELNQIFIEANTEEIHAKNLLTFKKTDNKEAIDKNPNMAFLDFDKLKFPLSLRTWKVGDYFMPLGMSGKKKLSDFMIDAKIPLNLKKEQEIILSGEDIVWVVGKRIDNRFKVTNVTKNIFVITRSDANV